MGVSAHACTQPPFHFHTLKIKGPCRLGCIRLAQTKPKRRPDEEGLQELSFQILPKAAGAAAAGASTSQRCPRSGERGEDSLPKDLRSPHTLT